MKIKSLNRALLKQSPVFDTVNIPSAAYIISFIIGYLSFHWINDFFTLFAFLILISVHTFKNFKKLTVFAVLGMLICYSSGYIYSSVSFMKVNDKYSKYTEIKTSAEVKIKSQFVNYDSLIQFEGEISGSQFGGEKCLVSVSGASMQGFKRNDTVIFQEATIIPVVPYRITDDVIDTPSCISDGIFLKINVNNSEPVISIKGKSDVFSFLETIKNKVDSIVYKYLDKDQYTFISGIVTGYKDTSNEQFYDVLNNTGISHTVVVSGMHFSIIISMLLYLMRTFGVRIKTASVITIFFSIFLALFYGTTPSVIRTLIMTDILLIADILERDKTFGIHFLSLSALLMILLNPFVIYDVSFIFSFGSVAGIKLFKEKISLKMKFLPVVIRECFSITISANLITLPFMMFYFGKISFGFILGNLIVTPFMSVILMYSVLTVILTLFFSFCSSLFIPLNYFLKLLFIPIKMISEVQFFSFDIYSPSFAGVFLYFTALSIVFLHVRFRIVKWCLTAAVMIYVIVTLFIPENYIIYGRSTIYALGKADSGKAVVISGTKTIVVDLSDSTNDYTLNRIISKKSKNHIDVYIINNKQSMESAINLSKNVKIDYIIYPEAYNNNFVFMEKLHNTGIKLISTKNIQTKEINNLLLTIGYDNNYNIMDVEFSGKDKKFIISGNFNKSPEKESINVLTHKKLMLYKYNGIPIENCVINSWG